jgi:hypothetical protein
MLGLGWVVEKDSFLASTPMGMKKMVTVVASLNPRNGVCLLDLAAHFENIYVYVNVLYVNVHVYVYAIYEYYIYIYIYI